MGRVRARGVPVHGSQRRDKSCWVERVESAAAGEDQ